MSKPKPPFLGVTATEPLLAAVDEYRFSRRVPSRSEAVRRLLLVGLKAEQEAEAIMGASKPKRRPKP